jgi:hypothetical protein
VLTWARNGVDLRKSNEAEMDAMGIVWGNKKEQGRYNNVSSLPPVKKVLFTGMQHKSCAYLLTSTPAAGATADRTQDCDQNTRTNEGNNDAIDEVSTSAVTKCIHDETTDKGTDDTNNDIANNAIAAATHDNACQETSNEADNNPEE